MSKTMSKTKSRTKSRTMSKTKIGTKGILKFWSAGVIDGEEVVS